MTDDPSSFEVFISMGGNIGDPSITIDDALAHLSMQHGIEVVTRSPFYKTPPWGKTDQAEFVNACACLKTSLSPQELLQTLLSVEIRMGRVRGERWGPRIIDLDILTFADQIVTQDNLIIPHPRIAERAFVLVPLRDIAPNFTLGGVHIDKLLDRLDLTGIQSLDPAIDHLEAV